MFSWNNGRDIYILEYMYLGWVGFFKYMYATRR